MPEETIPQRVKANSVPYDVWEKQGHLLATEGNVIHYDFIEKFICDLGEKYHILEIAVDRWNATHMIQNLEDAGFTMVPFGQGFASMSTPTKEFYRLLMEGQIVHAGHPVLRWIVGVLDKEALWDFSAAYFEEEMLPQTELLVVRIRSLWVEALPRRE